MDSRREYRKRVYARYVSMFKQPRPEPRALSSGRRASIFDYLLGELVSSRRPRTVLEVGCGPGHFLDWARARGLEVVGVDASPEQVAEARALGMPVELAPAQEYLEANRDRFDLIVALDFIEHLDRDEGLAVLDACH